MKTTLFTIFAVLNLLRPAFVEAADSDYKRRDTAACAGLWRVPEIATASVKSMLDSYEGNANIEKVKALVAAHYKEKGYLSHPSYDPFNALVTTQAFADLAQRGDWVIREKNTGFGPILVEPGDSEALGGMAPVSLGVFALTLPQPFPPARSAKWSRRKDGRISLELPDNVAVLRDDYQSMMLDEGKTPYQSLWLNLGPMPWSPEALWIAAEGKTEHTPLSMAGDMLRRVGAEKWELHDDLKKIDKPGWECYTWTKKRWEGHAKLLTGARYESDPAEIVHCEDFVAEAVCGDGKNMFSIMADLPDLGSKATEELPEHKDARAVFERALRSLKFEK